jgi:hypothetical protein
MNWAKRRQRLIEIILALVGVAVVTVVIIATVYKAPSCTDEKLNQGETGIDCGGPCPYLCSIDEVAPKVSFVRAISPQFGRTDVIAYVFNSNSNAGVQAAKYKVELYDSSNQVIASKEGTVNLPQSTNVPIYLPDFYHGNKQVAEAFLTFDQSLLLWMRGTARPIQLSQSNLQYPTTLVPTPKITATLTNPTAYPLYNQTVVVTVFDANNTAIAASQTVIPLLSAQGSAPVIFTWNQAFSAVPARVEILSVPTL